MIARLRERLADLMPRRNRVRDPRPRREYYDGTETGHSTIPPNRYARGTRATPAPPGPGPIGGF